VSEPSRRLPALSPPRRQQRIQTCLPVVSRDELDDIQNHLPHLRHLLTQLTFLWVGHRGGLTRKYITCIFNATCSEKVRLLIEGLRERTEHLDMFLFFHPSLNGVLFPMFCLLVEGECQILVF